MAVLILPSRIESTDRVQQFIEDLVENHNQFSSIFANILTAIGETVSNAIEHGNRFDASKVVSISYQVDGNTLTFKITDQGKGFDYTNVPDPTLPENIEKLSGRGIYIMHHLADSIEYEDNGSTVVVTFIAPETI